MYSDYESDTFTGLTQQTLLSFSSQSDLALVLSIPELLWSIIGINELINTYYRPSNNR